MESNLIVRSPSAANSSPGFQDRAESRVGIKIPMTVEFQSLNSKYDGFRKLTMKIKVRGLMPSCLSCLSVSSDELCSPFKSVSLHDCFEEQSSAVGIHTLLRINLIILKFSLLT